MIIHLHGKLAEHIGREVWNLRVKSVSEALRAIEANTDKLFRYLADAKNREVGYEVVIDDKICENPQELGMEGDQREVHLIPKIMVGKGVGKIIAGIILIVVAWYVLPYIWTAGAGWGGVGAGASLTQAGWVVGGFISTTLASVGFALVLGGLYELVVGTPEAPKLEDSNSSFLFSGPVNVTQQGNPVPIAYGEIICGSQVIDVSVRNVNYTSPTTYSNSSTSYPYDSEDEYWGSHSHFNDNSETIGVSGVPSDYIHNPPPGAENVRSYNVIDPNLQIIP